MTVDELQAEILERAIADLDEAQPEPCEPEPPVVAPQDIAPEARWPVVVKEECTIPALHELLPLVERASSAREFGALVIANVPARPRGTRQRLALAARDALGKTWADSVVKNWIAPSSHTKERREANRRWRKANSETIRRYESGYRDRRRAEDPAYALAHTTRRRIHNALRTAVSSPGKTRPALELLGCSAEEYRLHLESLWEPGMTWDNYGTEWEVDHIVPIAAHDLSTEEGQRAAFHWSNTQPMWVEDNRAKGSLWGGKRHRRSNL